MNTEELLKKRDIIEKYINEKKDIRFLIKDNDKHVLFNFFSRVYPHDYGKPTEKSYLEQFVNNEKITYTFSSDKKLKILTETKNEEEERFILTDRVVSLDISGISDIAITTNLFKILIYKSQNNIKILLGVN